MRTHSRNIIGLSMFMIIISITASPGRDSIIYIAERLHQGCSKIQEARSTTSIHIYSICRHYGFSVERVCYVCPPVRYSDLIFLLFATAATFSFMYDVTARGFMALEIYLYVWSSIRLLGMPLRPTLAVRGA